jgi:hypothetical protein
VIDEQLCQNVLSLKSDYLDAYPSLLDEWTDGDDLDTPDEGPPGLDARAQEYAAGLAADADLPV